MPFNGITETARALSQILFLVSKYLSFLAIGVGAVLLLYRGSTNYRNYALGLIYGGGASLIVYFSVTLILGALAAIMGASGTVANNGAAMLSPSMVDWAGGEDSTMYRVAGATSSICQLLGQGFIAIGAALTAVGRPKRTFSRKGKRLAFGGVVLIIVSMGGVVFAALVYIFQPAL